MPAKKTKKPKPAPRKVHLQPGELDPLAGPLELALAKSGQNPSAFGYVHFGDPAFIGKMRKGRVFRDKMADKIRSVLAQFDVPVIE